MATADTVIGEYHPDRKRGLPTRPHRNLGGILTAALMGDIIVGCAIGLPQSGRARLAAAWPADRFETAHSST